MDRLFTSIAIVWSAGNTGRVSWGRWGTLVFVAVAGSLLYGASLGLVLAEWKVMAAALWLALSAGMAWCVLIPVLCRFGKVGLEPCCDACLVTMAFGESVLMCGALINTLLWWHGMLTHAVGLNILTVGHSNLIMALVLVHRLRPHGVSPGRVWAIWMIALNGSGAVFFLLFYQWLHRA